MEKRLKIRHKNFLWRYGRFTPVFILLLALTLSLFISGDVRAANDESSISIEMGSLPSFVLRPGIFDSSTSTVTVTTDNNTGYKLIMQTDGESTDMTDVNGSANVIPTISLPDGVESVTASSFGTGYGYSIDGTNFKPAPSVSGEGDILAEVDYISGETTTEHNITFGMKVDYSSPAGDYEKTFVFTAIANLPNTCDADAICYNANGGNGTMPDVSTSTGASLVLSASNFDRSGYGFAGWNTRPDGTGTNFGPHETITVGDVSEYGMNLYAKWVRSSGTLQNWSGCDSMSIGDVTALTDSRDNNTYAVAKLADGACWMTENLRLDLANQDLTIDASNTDHPTASFMTSANAHPASSSSFCTTTNENCLNHIYYNAAGVDENSSSYQFSYGVYYNWYTATAGNGLASTSTPLPRVAGSICPAGWTLPSGHSISGDYAILDLSLGGKADNGTSTLISNRWRSYPNNFLFSGQQNGNSITSRGETGNYIGANGSAWASLRNMWLQINKVSVNSNGSNKNRGQTVRCMMQKYYMVHFDKNSELTVDGTMNDHQIPLGHSVALYQNTYSISPQNHAIYTFAGWNTEADGSGTAIADMAKVQDLGLAGETVTLYAQWNVTPTADITVSFQDESVTMVRFSNSSYGNQTATPENSTVTIIAQVPYTITATVDPNYDFIEWTAGNEITLSSDTSNPTTLTTSSSSTLSASTELRQTTFYLQDITLADCTTSPRIGIDTRDGESYHFGLLADGNCWLLDNLRLGSSELLEQLSSENTNMAEDAEPFTFETPERINSYTEPQIDLIRNGTTPTHYGAVGGDAGVYYNYCAATANTICSDSSPQNASYDICPAGWKLPTGGGTSEFATLYSSYNGDISLYLSSFSISLAGWYHTNETTYKELNKTLVLWSSTHANNTNKNYVAIINSTRATSTTGYLENNGFSIRCVMK